MAELKLHSPRARSGNFSIERQHYENVGLNERLISMLLGGVLMGRSIGNPFRSRFLYGAYLAYRGFTGNCVLYDYLGINGKKPHAINIRGEFEIELPPAEVYSQWRNLNNLSGHIDRLLNVKVRDEKLSSWKAGILHNLFSMEWEAQIVKDQPGHLIGWRATKDSLLRHVGRVEFEKTADPNITLLKIVLSYHPPGGGLGIGLSKLLNPYFEQLLKKEIKNFKYNVENRTPVFI
ncbi:YgaP-like transmembrane domain [Pedobacter nutrimenti]|uniref:Putative membrane protein n=1 Tax=Pedobacter nutrimenti TaxID=1241337 RepID=A0A318UL20_9SPHI|nr:YgaP-like transmembrane domain [Pedobacter nutrimenti]PYF69407.1 putative membrane protein [Pedobacter nutrimenti]